MAARGRVRRRGGASFRRAAEALPRMRLRHEARDGRRSPGSPPCRLPANRGPCTSSSFLVYAPNSSRPHVDAQNAINKDYRYYALHKENVDMRGLNLDQLRTFAGVVELKSFSAAAERLGISQPAVSLQVRQLERRFGVKLIERVGRNATPTAAGLEFLGHARNVEAAVDSATEAMAPHASGMTGRVRLGSGATACIYLLPPALRDLRQRFPALEIVVSTGNTPDMLHAIEENRIDAGLVTLPAPGRMFDIRPVLADEFVLVA